MFDFDVRDNLIITKKSIIAVFQIEPVDIALLDIDGQTSFFSHLSTVFNILQGEVQFNVVGKRSNIDDFRQYFNSMRLQNLSDQNRIGLVNNIVADMCTLIEDPEEQILTKSFFFHLKEICKTKSESSLVESVRSLSLRVQRITGALIHTGIFVEQVKGKNLRNYIMEYL